jgi:hypothetical protein
LGADHQCGYIHPIKYGDLLKLYCLCIEVVLIFLDTESLRIPKPDLYRRGQKSVSTITR